MKDPAHLRRPPSVVYVTAEYPAPSHTFILREVRALRALDVNVHTVSIRRTPSTQILSAHDRDEFGRTFAVLPVRVTKLLRSHLEAWRASPRHYLATLASALRPRGRGPRAHLWQLFYFAEAMIVWSRCDELGLHHLHAHFANVASDVAALTAEFGTRTGPDNWTWSMTVHGSSDFLEMESSRLLDKVHRASQTVCVSEFGRSHVLARAQHDDWSKVGVVHCGVDPSEYRPVEHQNGSSDELRILTVGRLVVQKGHAVLLEALAELARRGLRIDQTIVGDGPQRASLERQAARLGLTDQIRFEGTVGQDRIRDYYANADVFCLPSLWEGLPVVLMEAMAMEIPVVSTTVSGIPELVEEGVSGLLAPPARPDLIADALAQLAGSPDERRRMGEAGRQKVVAEFDVNRSAEQLRDMFARGAARV